MPAWKELKIQGKVVDTDQLTGRNFWLFITSLLLQRLQAFHWLVRHWYIFWEAATVSCSSIDSSSSLYNSLDGKHAELEQTRTRLSTMPFLFQLLETAKLHQVQIWVGWFGACKGSKLVLSSSSTCPPRLLIGQNKFQRWSLLCVKRRGFIDLPSPRL